MSLNPQRLASIGLVAVAIGGLAWTEFGGKPVGPALATAGTAPDAPVAAASSAGTAQSEAARDDFRIALAGMLRNYANENSLDVDRIDDPFIEPAAWTAAPVIEISDEGQPVEVAPDRPEQSLTLTAVLDAPTGPVARVNGVLLVMGRATEMPGVGVVELVEVGDNGRSAVVKTPTGMVRVRLSRVIGAPDA